MTANGFDARVELLLRRIDRLVAAREALHERPASEAELEHNRTEIVRAQRELSQALIDRYCLRGLGRNYSRLRAAS